MPDEYHVSPPVLELSTLIGDAGSILPAARDLVQAVVDDLDVDDPAVSDHYWREEWAPGVAAAMRAILAPHRPDPDGWCARCSPPPAEWPCALWRTAHRWMVELDPATGDFRNNWYVATSATKETGVAHVEPSAGPGEHPPIRCILELQYDGKVAVVAKHGCTDADIQQMLLLLAHADWTPESTTDEEPPVQGE